MILATVKDPESRNPKDGRLALVLPDRKELYLPAPPDEVSLLSALENLEHVGPRLEDIDAALRSGQLRASAKVSEDRLLAPLPRTWAFLDGSAYLEHVRLARKARGAEPPADLETVPLMYQGASDNLLPGTEDIPLLDQSHGMDFEAELFIITDFVPAGTQAADAAKHIKLVGIMNDVSLRELIPREVGTGFGFLHGKPPSSFAPFVVTPDELGDAWVDGRVHLTLETFLNGKRFGHPNAGEMHFSFCQLIEHAAKTRDLSAGTIIGSGTVSNQDASVGSSCIVEQRMREKLTYGQPRTPWLQHGDLVTMRMVQNGVSIFGDINQKVVGR